MNRHRAERLAKVAQSKGIYARVYGSAPHRPGVSTPWLHCVVLSASWHRLPAWCYNTSHFFSTLRYLLDYRRTEIG